MMTHPFFNRLPKFLLTFAVVGALTACDGNPVEGEEDHPVGLVLLDAQGRPVVSIAAGPTVTGQISVAVNGTQTYTVAATSEAGSRLTLDGSELAVRIATQPQNATVALQGANQLTVVGRSAGNGTINLVLMHEGHDELAGNVPVVVQ